MKVRPALNHRLSLLLALLIATLPAAAQFNGPATSNITGYAQPGTVTVDREILFPKAHDQVLTPGDLLQIRLFAESDFTPSVRIADDGTVLLPLIGVVSLRGLTIADAELLLARKLTAGGFYKDPQVSIQIAEGPNAVATVVGEAHGIIAVTGSRRLLDILSSAGGLPGSASHVITINRPGVATPIVVDLGTDPLQSEFANIPIYAGDTIVVSRIGVVYVLGSFKTQGAIGLNSYSPLTLTQVTALSGGTAFDAKMGDLRIIRTTNGVRSVVKLDIHAVLYGKAPDPILQPNDIVFLPNSAIKAAYQNGGVGTLLGVAGLILTIALRN